MTTPTTTPLPGPTDPAAAVVVADLTTADMQLAADLGRYGIHSHQHPVVLAWVDVSGRRLGIRLDVTGYPGTAPAGQPWDLATNTPLPVARWPHGGRPASGFRPEWSPSNGNAPYLACDRIGLSTHGNWANDLPGKAWTSSHTISNYLEQLRTALTGATLPQENPA